VAVLSQGHAAAQFDTVASAARGDSYPHGGSLWSSPIECCLICKMWRQRSMILALTILCSDVRYGRSCCAHTALQLATPTLKRCACIHAGPAVDVNRNFGRSRLSARLLSAAARHSSGVPPQLHVHCAGDSAHGRNGHTRRAAPQKRELPLLRSSCHESRCHLHSSWLGAKMRPDFRLLLLIRRTLSMKHSCFPMPPAHRIRCAHLHVTSCTPGGGAVHVLTSFLLS